MSLLNLLPLEDYVLHAHSRLCAAGGAQAGHAQAGLAASWHHLTAPLDEAAFYADPLPVQLPAFARVIDAANTLKNHRAHWDQKGFPALESGCYVLVVEAQRGCGPSGLSFRAENTKTWLDFFLWEFTQAPGAN